MKDSQELLIIGFGNQAKAWALNLKDSGWDVAILLRPNSSKTNLVKELGFDLFIADQKIEIPYKNIAFLIPDNEHHTALKNIAPLLLKNSRLIFAHGYSQIEHKLHQSYPEFRHLLLAPKSIASELRFSYETKGKISGVYSCELSTDPSDEVWLKQLSLALGLNVGPFPVSFLAETEADLFSEQALLCGLYPYAIQLAYQQLREKNIPKELAFLECWHESKLIMNAMINKGPKDFFAMISPNALIGSQKAQKILNEKLAPVFNELYESIHQQKFYHEVRETKLDKLKKEVDDFWQNQEIQKTYNELKHLYE